MKNIFITIVVLIILSSAIVWVKGFGTSHKEVMAVIETNNINDCEKFNDTDRVDCVSAVAFKQKDVKLCNILGSDELVNINDGAQIMSKDICIAAVAEAVLDAQLCRQIENTSLKDNCIYLYAVKKQDSSACTEILSEETKSECNELLMISRAGYCEGLDIAEQDLCFLRKGSNFESVADCAKSGKMKDLCYGQVAEKKQDQSICDEIEKDSEKEYCISRTRTSQ